ncbi:MAG: hypothetical protein OHK0022_41920 [Roseiflexaceae bacterium]
MIDWLVQTAIPGSALAGGTAPAGLLAPAEQERLVALRFDKRRRDWLLGRWTAKQLLRRSLVEHTGAAPPLASLVILPAPDGAPLVQVAGQAPALSISHSHGRALCALSWQAGLRLGADIEAIEPRDPVFVADYFSRAERALLEPAPAELRDTLITAVWSAKEAALKVLRLGLTVDTRSVTCLPALARATAAPSSAGCALRGAGGWLPLAVSCTPGLGGTDTTGVWEGWWCVQDAFVLTIVSCVKNS